MSSLKVKKFDNQFCWLSGWTQSFRPEGWHGPWMLHIAHIASGAAKAFRADDARAVILLSPLCHDLHVCDAKRLPSKWICGKEWPTIDESHTIWLKQKFDPENYDPEFLRKIWNGIPPEPERPPSFWMDMLSRNQGVFI